VNHLTPLVRFFDDTTSVGAAHLEHAGYLDEASVGA